MELARELEKSKRSSLGLLEKWIQEHGFGTGGEAGRAELERVGAM